MRSLVCILVINCYEEESNNCKWLFQSNPQRAICFDIDQHKVDMITDGQITILEPGLEILFKRNFKEDR